MKRRESWLFIAALSYACSDDHPGSTDTNVSTACSNETTPPSTLACTGLFADIRAKTIGTGVERYTPATELWADGAEKSRWIALPQGTTIDTSAPSDWRFPVGTKAWKEFRVGGKRVETRLWQKATSVTWVSATYAWNDDESSAVLSGGGDVTLASGATYHIPTNDECQQCHRGRPDRLLGFEQVLLGLDGASGFTLAELVAQGRLSVPPSSTKLALGDDGTGKAADAMRWIHANCGVTCHNANSTAIGYAAKMNLRLDPTMLDGRPSNDSGLRATTLDVAAVTPQWQGGIRIVPGDPDGSLLVQLVSRRADNDQMPPLATRVVDGAHVAIVRGWIAAMPRVELDAGVDAAPPSDAGDDAAGGAGDDAAGGAATDASDKDASDGGDATPIADAGTDAAAGSIRLVSGGSGVGYSLSLTQDGSAPPRR